MSQISRCPGARRRTSVGTVAVLVAVLVGACAPAETARHEGDDPRNVVARHLDRAAHGDVDGAIALLADEARWSFRGIDVVLGEPVPDDAAWVAEALGVPPPASPRDLVVGTLRTLAVREARPDLAQCTANASAVTCRYTMPDVFSELFGAVERGTIDATVDAGRITSLVLSTDEQGDPASPEFDAFRRWLTVQSAGVEPPRTFVDELSARVAGLEAWIDAGRPDIDAPSGGSGPVDKVLAWLDARNGRDFTSMVALMAGEALDGGGVGSWAEFEAARVLDRVIVARSCEVTAEGERLGAFVACDVEITDIIVRAAGTTSTNLNQSTFRVRDGRIVALPQYFPSSFVAESAVEDWAEAAQPAAYAVACPDGIAGQSPVDGLACARFIAETIGGWGPIVESLGLDG